MLINKLLQVSLHVYLFPFLKTILFPSLAIPFFRLKYYKKEMMFLLNNSLGVLQNKPSSY